MVAFVNGLCYKLTTQSTALRLCRAYAKTSTVESVSKMQMARCPPRNKSIPNPHVMV